MRIRPHTLADSDAIADILADGWRAAYAGFMPPAHLATKTDRALRRAEIAEWLRDEFDPALEHVLVAEDATATLTGFVHIVLEDKESLGADASINLLYVRPDRFGHGTGRALMAAAAGWLAPRIAGPVVLSAFAENPHAGFYARIGGTEVLRKTHDIAGRPTLSLYYRWDNPSALRVASAPTA